MQSDIQVNQVRRWNDPNKKCGLLNCRAAALILHICAIACGRWREIQVILEGMSCEASIGLRGMPAERLLVAIKAAIRRFQKILRRLAIRWIDRRTDADRQPWLIGLLAQAIGDALRNLLDPLRVRINQEDGEFVAAVTRGNIGSTAILFHHAGQTPQGAVACQMAQPVVDALQVVQVEKQ